MNADEGAQSGWHLGHFVIVLLFFFAPGPFGLLPSLGQAEEARTNIVYGDDHAFAIKAPQGWILDNKSGASIGLHAIFYPLGSTWRDSRAMMCVNTAGKDTKDGSKINGNAGALLVFSMADRLCKMLPELVHADTLHRGLPAVDADSRPTLGANTPFTKKSFGSLSARNCQRPGA